MTTYHTSDVIATVLSVASVLTIFMIKYYTFGVNVESVNIAYEILFVKFLY